jgi:hypothetical protein
MGFTCKRCGQYFCASDRLPEAHDCVFKYLTPQDILVRQLVQGEPSLMPSRPPGPSWVEPGPRFAAGTRTNTIKFDDELDDTGNANNEPGAALNPVADFSSLLFALTFFSFFDTIFLVFSGSILLFLPIIFHVVFLPMLFWIASKQKRAILPPRSIVSFVKDVIIYLVSWFSAEVIVAIFDGDLIMIVISLFTTIIMLLMLFSLLQRLKHVLGNK